MPQVIQNSSFPELEALNEFKTDKSKNNAVLEEQEKRKEAQRHWRENKEKKLAQIRRWLERKREETKESKVEKLGIFIVEVNNLIKEYFGIKSDKKQKNEKRGDVIDENVILKEAFKNLEETIKELNLNQFQKTNEIIGQVSDLSDKPLTSFGDEVGKITVPPIYPFSEKKYTEKEAEMNLLKEDVEKETQSQGKIKESKVEELGIFITAVLELIKEYFGIKSDKKQKIERSNSLLDENIMLKDAFKKLEEANKELNLNQFQNTINPISSRDLTEKALTSFGDEVGKITIPPIYPFSEKKYNQKGPEISLTKEDVEGTNSLENKIKNSKEGVADLTEIFLISDTVYKEFQERNNLAEELAKKYDQLVHENYLLKDEKKYLFSQCKTLKEKTKQLEKENQNLRKRLSYQQREREDRFNREL